MKKIYLFLLSFLLVTTLGLTSFDTKAGLRTKAFIVASGFVASKVITAAIKSPRTHAWFLKNTINNPAFKKKAISTIEKYIASPKNKRLLGEAKTLLSQVTGKIKKLPKPKKTTGEIRGSPGTAWGTKGLSKLAPSKWKNAISGEGASIPASVGHNLSGKKFNTFDSFRKTFWKELSKDKDFMKQFSKSNQTKMKKGNVPRVVKKNAQGENNTYQIHHKKPIEDGGAVYSMDNLIIVTPVRHKKLHDILRGLK